MSETNELIQLSLRRLPSAVRGLAFWMAVLLPGLHLPLLLSGIQSQAELIAFFSLLGANVAAILLGHSHVP
jgi:hypothetical protein